jgi:hypothetical protein
MRLISTLAVLLSVVTLASPALAQQSELKSEGTVPGLSIVIQDLKRDPANSVTLRFQMINASDKSIGLGGKFKDPASKVAGGNEISGVHLIDNVNKKKYLVVRDTEGKCACAEIRSIEKGARANLWAKFAAPPEAVDKITVVVPEFQAIDNVTITR